MLIACLAWGSLIWDPRTLPVQDDWQPNGPYLPIEFARQSQDNRITLVCVPSYLHQVQSFWAFLSSPDLDAAREALRAREGIKTENIDTHIGVWTPRQAAIDDLTTTIGAWASNLQLDAVIWTNLSPKFQGEDGRIPSAAEVINHLSNLSGEQRKKAEAYIRKTPRQIRTPYRIQIEASLGWVPEDFPT